MRRYCLFLCGFALLSAAPAYAQNTILPKQFSGWNLTRCIEHPPELILANEAGQRQFEACTYESGDRGIGIRLGLYRDSSSAYEIFTSHFRTGEMPTNLGQAAAFDEDRVLLQEGSLVLELGANISRNDLSALVKAVESSSEKSPLPPIRTYLPVEGRLVGTERYALGPEGLKRAISEAGLPEMPALVRAIGFGKEADAEAMLARYSTARKGNGVLLLLEYPTPNVAEQHIHHLSEVLPTEANRGEESILRKGSLLSIVLSASSPEFAKSLREASNYETQVTWNEPSQTLTDPPLMSTMVKIFVGTGVFMVAAIVLGIAFGGVRIITKRLFPGKVFDRPAQMEVLQLGLSSKPIDPTDLY